MRRPHTRRASTTLGRETDTDSTAHMPVQEGTRDVESQNSAGSRHRRHVSQDHLNRRQGGGPGEIVQGVIMRKFLCHESGFQDRLRFTPFVNDDPACSDSFCILSQRVPFDDHKRISIRELMQFF